jgi:hypothetical protein
MSPESTLARWRAEEEAVVGRLATEVGCAVHSTLPAAKAQLLAT